MSNSKIFNIFILAGPILFAGLDSSLFGASWYLLGIVGFFYMLQDKRNIGTQGYTWILACTPFLLIQFAYLLGYNLPIGRAEFLEVALGGLCIISFLNATKIPRESLVLPFLFSGVFFLSNAIIDVSLLGYVRAGHDFNPINFGIGAGSIALLAWSATETNGQNSKITNVFFLCALLAAIAMIMSDSRGPILSFIFCSLVIFYFTSRANKQNLTPTKINRKLGFHLTIVVLIIIGLYEATLRTLSAENSYLDLSTTIRLGLFNFGVEYLLQHPIVGVGPDQSGALLKTLTEPLSNYNHLHNTMITVAVEHGIMGVIALLWFLGFLIYRTTVKSNHHSAVFYLNVLLIFFILSSMTQDILSHSYTRKIATLTIILSWLLIGGKNCSAKK